MLVGTSGKPCFALIADAVPVVIEEGLVATLVCHCWTRHVAASFRPAAAGQRDRRRQAVDDLIVPLVEDRDVASLPSGIPVSVKVAVGVALGEREVLAVRIAQGSHSTG